MHPASAIPGAAHQAAREAVHEVAPWIARLARLGFVANAILYMTVGALATCAALRLAGTEAPARGATVGSRGAMAALLAAPAGHTLLGVMAVGLFGYGLWQLIEAITDPGRVGHRAWGLAQRIGSAGVAVLFFWLGYSALQIAFGHARGAGDSREATHWTARALATPGGTYAVYATALGVVAYGLYQLYCAARAKLDDQLSLARVSPRARRWLIGISRFGIAMRGVVFITAGGLVASGARKHDPAEVAQPARPLRELLELGTVPFMLIAIGLVAYGVYQLIDARYRRIEVAR